jgi:hypothetical protein
VLALVACGRPGATLVALDGSLPPDASAIDVDAHTTGCTADGVHGVPCAVSVATLCGRPDSMDGATFTGCGDTWMEVTSSPPCGLLGGSLEQVQFVTCGLLDEMAIVGLSSGTYYGYAADSGQLVSVLAFDEDGGLRCVAGPSCAAVFTVPMCSEPRVASCARDAGALPDSDPE